MVSRDQIFCQQRQALLTVQHRAEKNTFGGVELRPDWWHGHASLGLPIPIFQSEKRLLRMWPPTHCAALPLLCPVQIAVGLRVT